MSIDGCLLKLDFGIGEYSWVITELRGARICMRRIGKRLSISFKIENKFIWMGNSKAAANHQW